jgi:hypothetical protein
MAAVSFGLWRAPGKSGSDSLSEVGSSLAPGLPLSNAKTQPLC